MPRAAMQSLLPHRRDQFPVVTRSVFKYINRAMNVFVTGGAGYIGSV